MQAAFNEKFTEFISKCKYTHVPTSDTYNEILSVLQNEADEHKAVLERQRNYARRFHIALINGVEKLYRGNKLVVTRDEVICFIFLISSIENKYWNEMALKSNKNGRPTKCCKKQIGG